MVDANSHDAPPRGTIFISYSRRDEEFADRLAASLRDRGFEALIDRRDIRALEDWRERIRTLIAQADTVVFVLSPDAVASPICQEEVDFAAVLNKRFAPILHRQVSARTVPAALARLNWVAFDNPAQFEDGLARLVDALNTDITWIRKHTELGLAARRWEAAGRPGPSGLMLRPPLLDEAEGWVAWQPRGAPAPTEAISAFIAMSREVFAHEQAARKAEIDRYLLSQSRFMADLANQHRQAGDCAIAMALAIEALPRAGDQDARPHAVEAERALFSALGRLQEITILPGHSGPAVFGPDGRSVITTSGNVTRVWDVESGATLLELGDRPLCSAAFSPDGRLLAGAHEERGATIWDLQTGRRVRSPAAYENWERVWDPVEERTDAILKGQLACVVHVAFSPDSRLLAGASRSATVTVWDAATGETVAVLHGHAGAVERAHFSHDCGRIVTASEDNSARVWDVSTGRAVAVLDGHRGGVHDAAFHPDGQRLATAAGDGKVRIWEVSSGKPIRVIEDHAQDVNSVAFSPDGCLVLTASSDGTARLSDAEGVRPVATLRGHLGPVLSAAMSADGRRVITTSLDGTARIWRVQPATIALPHSTRVMSAAFSPDGRRLASGSVDTTTVPLWDVETARPIVELEGHTEGILSAAFSPDGGRVLTTSNDGTACLWEAQTGRRLATVAGDQVREVWDDDAQMMMKLPMEWEIKERILSAGFFPDGSRAILASEKSARLIDPATGETIGKVDYTWQSTTFSPDGQLLVARNENSAFILDVEPQRDAFAIRRARELQGHAAPVMHAVCSPDGRRVATASLDGTTRIWDVATRQTVTILTGHAGPLFSTAFSPDGRHVLTAGADGTARVWNVETGEMIHILEGHTAQVNGAVFSPDGRRIATASDDKTVRLWRAYGSTQDLIDEAMQALPRGLAREQRIAAFLDPEPPAWYIELEKWPYHTAAWKDWLRCKRANANPPRPDSPEWNAWRMSHNV